MARDHKADKHYKKAKREGYRARSAYKLLDIQKRFNVFKRAFYILDLGSAPGSWLQVCQEKAEKNLQKYQDKHYHRDHYKIMGVDLKHVSPIEGTKTLRMDFTESEFIKRVREFFEDEPLDLVLSDASIKKSGIHFSDQIKQIRLGRQVLELAGKFLKPGGDFVVKAFQGTDFPKFLKEVKREFRRTKSYKPQASKSQSNEIYVVGSGKR